MTHCCSFRRTHLQNTLGAVCLWDSCQLLELFLLTGGLASCLHLPPCLHGGHCLTHYKVQGWGQGGWAARRAGVCVRTCRLAQVGRAQAEPCWPAPALCTAPLVSKTTFFFTPIHSLVQVATVMHSEQNHPGRYQGAFQNCTSTLDYLY